MNIDSLNRWLSFAANFGVVLGIIFLAIELRQNNELLQAEARYNRLETRNEGNYELLRNRDLTAAIEKLENGEELSSIEETSGPGRELSYRLYDPITTAADGLEAGRRLVAQLERC